MALDGVSKLGDRIGKTASDTDELQQNISPNEDVAIDTVKASDTITSGGTLTITKKVYKSDSFIIDDETQGELDNTSLKLDGGYDVTQEEVLTTIIL